jgi:hypothetical protein
MNGLIFLRLLSQVEESKLAIQFHTSNRNIVASRWADLGYGSCLLICAIQDALPLHAGTPSVCLFSRRRSDFIALGQNAKPARPNL